MISLKKIQFLIMLVAGFIFMPLFATEPNEPNKPAAELKFEISDYFQKWLMRHNPGRGPVRPEYMAEFYIKESSNMPNSGSSSGTFESLLETQIGKSMSAGQREFLETSSSYESSLGPFPEKPIGYIRIHLYAVSQEDAKKTVQAYIEQTNEKTQERIKKYKDYIRDSEQILSESKDELPKKESQLKEVEEEYKKIKEKTHQFSSDGEAFDLAKKSIIEMDKTFNDFEIELAGIQERLKTIKDYQNKQRQRPELVAKLDSMYIDLMIELSGLEARRKVAKYIYSREQEFLSLLNKKSELQKEVDELNNNITKSKRNIEKATNDYNQRKPDFLPAEIYKDTVTIYPVADQ